MKSSGGAGNTDTLTRKGAATLPAGNLGMILPFLLSSVPLNYCR